MFFAVIDSYQFRIIRLCFLSNQQYFSTQLLFNVRTVIYLPHTVVSWCLKYRCSVKISLHSVSFVIFSQHRCKLLSKVPEVTLSPPHSPPANGGSSPSTLKEVSITKIGTTSCNLLWFGRRRGPINQGHICVHDAASASGDKASACMGDRWDSFYRHKNIFIHIEIQN